MPLKAALRDQYFDYERSVENMQEKVFFAINPDGEIKLQHIFDHIAGDRARMKYRQPRRSSGQWTTMIEPPPVMDKTINFDKSVYGCNGSMYF
ncbi:Oidioi.mRNA.OKI2018_I69.PAR.g12936.t1.cds [Oikopleura dioica]|uniref:Oidioi.mRNA.OKI2018_I69.PAR.g12936.t1.cds n=1 Tax=Oikopleura dioica TaxID=34765 RepID=A0ABN7S9A3_OIKDI|nr:Oidioi.mRNA.OKI2018_I69.PAR.g12936.t1.cds [Oikopleura dioica]